MHVAEQDPFVLKLVGKPYDQQALVSVHEALAKDPRTYATLLETAAGRTAEHVAASHWLTEAARVNMHALSDERRGVRLLEAALERDPLNLRAAEHLVELYRAHHEDRELAEVLRATANTLRKRYASEPVEMPRAAIAFEKLSGVYEAIGDSAAAIQALRTALELERAQTRYTTPSPPPDGSPPESSTPRKEAREGEAPAPEPRWTASPPGSSRDTVRSSLPAGAEGQARPSTEPLPFSSTATTLRSEPPRPDPLLAVIEALHALRHSDDIVEGAALVLRTALDAIPSVAGFVHVADMGARDFVVVAASGAHNTDVIGTRAGEEDPLLVRALTAMQTVAFAANASGVFSGERFRVVSPIHAVLCAPVQFDGRHLGAIELVDPTRTSAFTDADRHAMTYVGERFAEFLSDRDMTF
ncbi:MAG TPA: GAF domain-containing protein [Polyangiaceae bacterium]